MTPAPRLFTVTLTATARTSTVTVLTCGGDQAAIDTVVSQLQPTELLHAFAVLAGPPVTGRDGLLDVAPDVLVAADAIPLTRAPQLPVSA